MTAAMFIASISPDCLADASMSATQTKITDCGLSEEAVVAGATRYVEQRRHATYAMDSVSKGDKFWIVTFRSPKAGLNKPDQDFLHVAVDLCGKRYRLILSP
jgi:hypothetical protein